MWKLLKIEAFNEKTGKWTDDSFFEGWNGYIIYDGEGHMAADITPKGYKDFDAEKNIDSLDAVGLKALANFYKSNFVYFANYKITGVSIDHQRLMTTNPKDWGSVLTRDFEFRHDTLLLSPHEILWQKKSRLWWVKM